MDKHIKMHNLTCKFKENCSIRILIEKFNISTAAEMFTHLDTVSHRQALNSFANLMAKLVLEVVVVIMEKRSKTCNEFSKESILTIAKATIECVVDVRMRLGEFEGDLTLYLKERRISLKPRIWSHALMEVVESKLKQHFSRVRVGRKEIWTYRPTCKIVEKGDLEV